MGNHDFNEESSESECDDYLQREIEALSRACMPTGHAPTDAGLIGGGYFSEDDDDDDFDDLEMVRSIQERYGAGVSNTKPLATLPPSVFDDDDDDEDDFEIYRATKERFAQYGGDVACGGGRDCGDAKESKDGSCKDMSMSHDAVGVSFGRDSVDVHRDDVEREPYDTAGKEDASSSASSFPWAAQTFIEAIKKNRSCQKLIRSKMLHIEARMEGLKKLCKRLKILRDFQTKCKRKIGRALSQKQDDRMQLISAPKRTKTKGSESGVSAMCYGPLENSYVACYKVALGKFPLSFHRDKWSEDERQNLEKGIVQQYQEKLLQRSAEFCSSAEDPCSTNQVDAIMLSIKNHNITPEMIQHFSREVNWERLANIYLPRRSGEECETRWLNHENRLINLRNWTREEDIHLLSLIEKNGVHNWESIAGMLKTNRTPFQCLARYQRSLNASILKRDWTEDEDAQLRSAVEYFGESNWQAVASVLEGRAGTQCSNRWKKTLHPAREKVGKWGDDEDKRLKVAVTLFGKSWHKIAQFVPGRTQAQCRERWVNVLDPSLNRCSWTEEEDLKLQVAIAEHGYSWSKVAACVPLRTDSQCRRRWTRLYPHEVPQLKAARNIQRAALISNFVDREGERPTLGPKDFVPPSFEGLTNEQENARHSRKRNRKRKVIDSTEKSTSSCSEKRRKRKKHVRLPDSKIIGDSGTAESNCENFMSEEKEIASKTASKTKKRNPIKTMRESKKKSCESTDTDEHSDIDTCILCSETEETNQGCEADSWDIPISIVSRRARRVRPKGNPSDISCKLYQASDIHGDANMSITVQNEVHHDQFIYSESQVNTDQSKEWEDLPLSVLFKKAASDVHGDANMSISVQNEVHHDHFTYSESQVNSDQSKEWEDLPLSILFKKASSDIHGGANMSISVPYEMQHDESTHSEFPVNSDQSKEWEDLPLSVLFSKAFTRAQRVANMKG